MITKFLLLIIIISYIKSEEDNFIISIQFKEGRFENIPTKRGLINFETRDYYEEYFIKSIYRGTIFIFEGMKNLSLFNFSEYEEFRIRDEKNVPEIAKLFNLRENVNLPYEIYGENKDSLKLDVSMREDCYSPLICKLFYKTNYIDKYIYSIGKINNKLYRFFGGTPQNITKNLNKFTFSKEDKVSEIKIEFNNMTKIYNFKEKELPLKISDDKSNLFFWPFFNSFLDEYEKVDQLFGPRIFQLNEEQKNLFPNISFQIGNKTIILNKDNALLDYLFFPNKDDVSPKEYYLHVSHSYENAIIFGKKFLDLFDFSEFNLENGEVNLYFNKSNNIIVENYEKKNMSLNLTFYNNCYLIVVLLFFIIFLLNVFIFRNRNKKKKIKYYNNYFKI